MEDVGNLGKKKMRGKNIAVNTIELRNWKWLLLWLLYREAVLETLSLCSGSLAFLNGIN